MIRSKIVTVAAVAAAVLGGGAYALASSSAPAVTGPVFHRCEGGVRGRIIYDVLLGGQGTELPGGRMAGFVERAGTGRRARPGRYPRPGVQ